jgi:hypothetical protein
VSIYKNWLYVCDEKAWEKGGKYVETVMQIQEGDLTYKDVTVIAKRGPQEGVFCIVFTPSWSREDKKFEAMVGAGVYGFEDSNWVGINLESMEFLKELLQDPEVPAELSKLDLSKALRFNQGDAYFATHLRQDIPCSPVGEADPTIMSQLFSNTPEDDPQA